MSPLSSRPKILTVFGVLLTTVYVATFVAFLCWQANVEEVTSSESHEEKKSADDVTLSATLRRKLKHGRKLDKRNAKNAKLPSSSISECDNVHLSLENETDSDQTQQQNSDSHDEFAINVESPTLPGCEMSPDIAVNQFQVVAGRHYVYSAYYDDRTATHKGSLGQPVVRIIALLRNSIGPRGIRPSQNLYCHVWLNGIHHSSPLDYYEMCENHGKQYGGWVLTCRLPTSKDDSSYELPCQIGVSADASDRSQIVKLTVFRTTEYNDVNNKQFAVCIPPLFGHVSSKTLVQFIELTHLIGFNHLVFYRSNQENDTTIALSKVLKHYRRMGMVSIIEWTLPNSLTTSNNAAAYAGPVWYHGQLVAINDCLYRSMHAFHRVAFNDVDEYIIPRRRHVRLDVALTNIDRKYNNSTPFCAYSFRSAFFDPMTSLVSVSDGSSTSEVVAYELESDLRTVALSNVRTKVCGFLIFSFHRIIIEFRLLKISVTTLLVSNNN
jgi:Glycosyltransferase family 92